MEKKTQSGLKEELEFCLERNISRAFEVVNFLPALNLTGKNSGSLINKWQY